MQFVWFTCMYLCKWIQRIIIMLWSHCQYNIVHVFAILSIFQPTCMHTCTSDEIIINSLSLQLMRIILTQLTLPSLCSLPMGGLCWASTWRSSTIKCLREEKTFPSSWIALSRGLSSIHSRHPLQSLTMKVRGQIYIRFWYAGIYNYYPDSGFMVISPPRTSNLVSFLWA